MAGTLVANTINTDTGLFSTNNAYNGIAKAWVNFDPSSGSSATIRASFNVSSVTYVTTGNYTLNFTTAFSDAYYAVAGAAKFNGTSNSSALRVISIGSNAATQANSQTTTTLDIAVTYANGSAQDPYTCTIVCFR